MSIKLSLIRIPLWQRAQKVSYLNPHAKAWYENIQRRINAICNICNMQYGHLLQKVSYLNSHAQAWYGHLLHVPGNSSTKFNQNFSMACPQETPLDISFVSLEGVYFLYLSGSKPVSHQDPLFIYSSFNLSEPKTMFLWLNDCPQFHAVLMLVPCTADVWHQTRQTWHRKTV